MKRRGVPAIALRKSNRKGGHYFMSLLTGKRIHSYHWKELAISDEIVERVEHLAKQEGQPLLKDKQPFFEWQPGVEMMDGESEGEYVGMIGIDEDAPRENKIIDIYDAQDELDDEVYPDEHENIVSEDEDEDNFDLDEDVDESEEITRIERPRVDDIYQDAAIIEDDNDIDKRTEGRNEEDEQIMNDARGKASADMMLQNVHEQASQISAHAEKF